MEGGEDENGFGDGLSDMEKMELAAYGLHG